MDEMINAFIFTRSHARRSKLFEAQDHVRELLCAAGIQAQLKYPANFHRTAQCLYTPFQEDCTIDMGSRGAYYRGLIRCRSVWCCPVCARTIHGRRRIEIGKAIDWASENQLRSVMTTLTFPHSPDIPLSDLLKMQKKAFKRLRSGRSWEQLKVEWGFTGMIRILEITHGRNGWHPHSHEVWFVDPTVNLEAMRIIVAEEWRKACQHAGILSKNSGLNLNDFLARSVKISSETARPGYLLKDFDFEKWSLQTPSNGGHLAKEPFDILQFARVGNEFAELFCEYAVATKNLCRVYWSAGLREMAGINKVSEAEFAEARAKSGNIVASISPRTWTYLKKNRLRAKILNAIENEGDKGMEKILSQHYRISH